MATANKIKARLLRGLVQENMSLLQGAKLQRRRARRYLVKPWWLAGLLVVGCAYLLRPEAPRISSATAIATAPVIASQATAPVDFETTPESAVAFDSPTPIDRHTIPLAIKRIVVDPGHGGGEAGAIAASGVTEKEITLDVALRLRRLLADAPFEVLLTRQSDESISLHQRVAFANDNKADLFVSIHVNWFERRTLRATETFYVGPSDDPATLKLASMENKDSGYSLSDYKNILEKIYVDARHDESRSLARAIQANLHRTLKSVNPQLESRGVKSAPFVVLIGTQMPAILVEISCLSNADEVSMLAREAYRESIARALVRGIRGYAQSLNGPETKGS